jgi:hypothetical protein
MPERAPRDYASDGSDRSGEFRVRAGWFGIAILEEKIFYRDGSVSWRRCNWLSRPIEFVAKER